jgi:hypothetical protein
MDRTQIKFKIIEHNSEDYFKCLELRSEVLGKDIDRIEIELERYYIHLAAKKGDHIIAIATLKPSGVNCQIKNMYFSAFARNYQFIQDEMLKVCQRIAWFYGFEEMFLEHYGCKVLLNLGSHLIGDGNLKRSADYKDRLKEIILYLLHNKNILLEYEIDYLLTHYQQLFGAISDEFIRGALTALKIRYEYEDKHRIQLQDTTYGDLKNILDELDYEKEILSNLKDLSLNPLDYTEYHRLIKLQCILTKGINIINILNQNNIKCTPYDVELLRYNAACSITIKQQDIDRANKCTNLSAQSKSKLLEYLNLLQSAIEDLANHKFVEALAKVERIDTIFIATENIKNSVAQDKVLLGKWTNKQLKK